MEFQPLCSYILYYPGAVIYEHQLNLGHAMPITVDTEGRGALCCMRYFPCIHVCKEEGTIDCIQRWKSRIGWEPSSLPASSTDGPVNMSIMGTLKVTMTEWRHHRLILRSHTHLQEFELYSRRLGANDTLFDLVTGGWETWQLWCSCLKQDHCHYPSRCQSRHSPGGHILSPRNWHPELFLPHAQLLINALSYCNRNRETSRPYWIDNSRYTEFFRAS